MSDHRIVHERAREAAAKAAAEVIQDAFARKARPVTDVSNAALDAFLASLAEDGMVLVPRVATPEMLYEMGQAANFHLPRDANRAQVWSAMVERALTAPPPPEAQG